MTKIDGVLRLASRAFRRGTTRRPTQAGRRARSKESDKPAKSYPPRRSWPSPATSPATRRRHHRGGLATAAAETLAVAFAANRFRYVPVLGGVTARRWTRRDDRYYWLTAYLAARQAQTQDVSDLDPRAIDQRIADVKHRRFSSHSSPSSCRLVMYLTMIGAEMCGMSLSGPIFASCTAERKRSAGQMDPRFGFSGRW